MSRRVRGKRSAVSGQRSARENREQGRQRGLGKRHSKTQNAVSVKELSDLQDEYDRLQQQLVQQRQGLWLEFQQASVQMLESLLLQLPTAAYAAQQNPQAPAVKLLPLLRPLDQLLESWGIESIASVGDAVPYDPQQHQLMMGTAQPGDSVKIRYTGYRQGRSIALSGKGERHNLIHEPLTRDKELPEPMREHLITEALS